MQLNQIYNRLFELSGGKLYFHYLLVTNPVSKNPLIKFLWGWMALGYTAWNYRMRYYSAIAFGGVHLVFGILDIFTKNEITITNMLFNIYPIMVQIWIGWRCLIVIKYKKRWDVNTY